MTLASMMTGLTLSCFSLVKTPWNAILSLLAVLIVLFYFRKNERRGLRIGFVVCSVLYYILFIFILSAYLYVHGLVWWYSLGWLCINMVTWAGFSCSLFFVGQQPLTGCINYRERMQEDDGEGEAWSFTQSSCQNFWVDSSKPFWIHSRRTEIKVTLTQDVGWRPKVHRRHASRAQQIDSSAVNDRNAREGAWHFVLLNQWDIIGIIKKAPV